MCTCNAGVFLQPQLDSIARQSRAPAHIVVCDDRSDDGTWERLQAWAVQMEGMGRTRVSLIRNEERLGVRRNFEQAIRSLETDVIFLADQDDIWANTKVAELMECLETTPSILLVHTDAVLIDGEGKDLGKSLFEALRLSPHEQALVSGKRFFEVYCRRNLVTGTTAAFRRELLELALPFPDGWIHDEWLAACAAAQGTVAMLPDRLTQYRQHGANVIGIPVSTISRLVTHARRVVNTPRDQYLRYKLARLEALHQRLESSSVPIPTDRLALLEEAQSHFLRRIAFRKSLGPRLVSVMRESRAHGYHRFADGFAGMVRDLIQV
ncbi:MULTISPECIES: glycosyltransferase family 2 protein [Ralstonia]|jgi:glycosyltransferase involved in cell wall biosynthesis|nr:MULTISPECIES: glycosyltransferase family 2 protein [Ralstonia]MBL4778263.1 glycosyltransferase family 2 protein [Ralstonia sp.]MEA3267543.1 glycosyltransferase family 2 protein [Pseudomonadota bacterium]